MRVIIIGAGKVGFNIGQILSNDNHDVVIERIKKDIKLFRKALMSTLSMEAEPVLGFRRRGYKFADL